MSGERIAAVSEVLLDAAAFHHLPKVALEVSRSTA